MLHGWPKSARADGALAAHIDQPQVLICLGDRQQALIATALVEAALVMIAQRAG